MPHDSIVIADLSKRLNGALRAAVPTPDPGIYPGVPMEQYHAWDAVSNSRLSKLRRSPAHLKAYLEEPPPDTIALVLGKAAHMAILEPELFQQKYCSGPEGDRRTKAVRDRWEQLEGQYGEGYVLKPADYAMCLRARDSFRQHSRAHALLSAKGLTEVSVVWDDPETGLRCKARYDFLAEEIDGLDGGVIVDLKSCRDAGRRMFERHVFEYGYHRQGCMYLDGAHAVRLNIGHYVIMPFEKDAPFAVAAYRITEGALDAGREQVRPLMRLYKHCVETDTWPAYPEEIVDIALPDWGWSVIDAEVSELEDRLA